MEASDVGRADVHAWTAANGLEALEDLDVLRAVGARRLLTVRRCRSALHILFLDGHVLSLCLSRADEQLVEALEVLVGIELDLDTTAPPAAEHLYLCAQR